MSSGWLTSFSVIVCWLHTYYREYHYMLVNLVIVVMNIIDILVKIC